MGGMPSARFPQSLGNDRYVHEPLVVITFPVGNSLATSLVAHLSCLEEFFLWPVIALSSLLELERDVVY